MADNVSVEKVANKFLQKVSTSVGIIWFLIFKYLFAKILGPLTFLGEIFGNVFNVFEILSTSVHETFYRCLCCVIYILSLTFKI